MNRSRTRTYSNPTIDPVHYHHLPTALVTYLLGAFSLLTSLTAGPFPLKITEIMYHPKDGKEYEFIELQNTGPTPMDISLATWDGIDFRFPESSVIQPSEIWILASNDHPEAFAERYPEVEPRGYFARKLSNSGETLTLFNTLGNPLAWASYRDGGFWPREADGLGHSLERYRLEDDPNSPTAWRLSQNPHGSPGQHSAPLVHSPIQIVEIFASADKADANEVDFVELWNDSDTDMNLAGWSLSDSADEPERHVFPPESKIGAKSFLSIPLVVSGDSEEETGFALNSNGETLFLYNNTGQPIDGIRFGQQPAGYSISRISTEWRLSFPTPGSDNTEAPTASPNALSINEWKADAEPGDSDWIELYNTNPSLPVSLASLCLGHGEILALPPEEVVISPFGADWAVFPARTSPTPDNTIQWPHPDFTPSDWETLSAPFFVGATPEGGTALLDMNADYSSLLIRREFKWSDFGRFESLQVKVRTDDGFIAWFNGLEWGRLHIPAGPVTIDILASNDGAGQVTDWEFAFENFPLFFNDGTNTIAVHGAASEPLDDDFFLDLSLSGFLPQQSAFSFLGSSPLSPLSFVAPNSYIRLNASEQTGVHDLQFRIPAEGTTLALTSAQGELLTSAPVSVASEGVSEGRAPDGSETIQYFAFGDSPGRPNLSDQDSDGIPDDAEANLGLDPEDPTDAFEDKDNDGLSNLYEIIVGTDPNDPLSLTRIQIQSLGDDGTLALIVPRLIGRSYSLETAADLSGAHWSEVSLIPARDPGEPGSLTTSIKTSSDTAFFRLVGLATPPESRPQQPAFEPPKNHSQHSPSDSLKLTLSRPLDPTTLRIPDAWGIVDDTNRPIEIEIRYDAAFTEVTLRPRLPLKTSTRYQVTVNPGVLLQNGESVISEIGDWTFSTVEAAALTDNPSIYEGDTDGVLRMDLFIADGETPFTFDDLLADNTRGDGFDPFVRVSVRGENYTPTLQGSNGTMKVRGASSRMAIQKSFRIDLDANEQLWHGHRRINLMKHPFELTRIRNRLSFELFKQIPHLTSLRTQFIHLFVNGEDMGLYSQIEQYDERFLQNHGLDPDGYLYKANFFEWFRYPDQLRLKSDPLYNKPNFESILEIETRDNHEKLLQLLDDINNPELDFQKTFNQYFNRDNYLTWLAINLLMGNIDSNSQNFLLYNPANSQTWYFLPWDYDGAWGLRRQPDNQRHEFPRWQEGLATYWNVSLHKQFMTIEDNRLALESRIAELRATHLSEQNVKAVSGQYRDIVETFISRTPDIHLLPVSRGEARTNVEVKLAEWASEFDRLPTEPAFNESLYFQALERPMPVFLGTPVQRDDSVQFTWSESSHLLNRPFHYDFELSTSPTFEDDALVSNQIGLQQTHLDLSPIPPPGDYYFRVIIRDSTMPAEHWQIPFSSFFDASEGRSHYGIRQFTVR